ncbi:non-ribosomal peptide synthetase [Streptomyces sp. NRRL S-31]|uniref:non-ribosomal peptide synthetase n=1 Tax=Streptomyces sp. NRRL S-31 TaxID=1463898 RepID=UPI0004CAEF47|nr:non-ribosomal peptide synthetase [Streptomyces sp. NRRL S-31]
MAATARSLLDGFDRAVRDTPDNEALRTVRSALTYRELGERVDEFADRLRRLTRPDECVALLGTRGTAAITAMIGALKARRPFVFVDERDSDASNTAKTGLLGVRLLARGSGGDGDGDLELTEPPARWRTAAGPPEPRRLPFADGEIGYAIHTSGSTGTPKCVLVRTAPLAPVIRDHVTRLSVGPGSRTLQFARLTFDGCLTEILWTLTAGACLVVVDEGRLAPGAVLADTLERFGITHLKTTPFALTVTEPTDGMRLEHVVNGGGPCRPAVVRTWSKAASFHNAYGLTETTVCNLLSDALDPDDCRDGVPLGELVGDCAYELRDAGTGATGPGIRRGELVVTGASVAAGYLTEQGVTPLDGPAGTGGYATGDVVELRDGRLYFVERLDRQMKVRGYRLDPGEIEVAVCRHPDVREAVVVAEAQSTTDPADSADPAADTLVCYYQGTADPRALRGHLDGLLDPYKIPSVLERVDVFPSTPNGKIDRDALRTRRHARTPADAPDGPDERLLHLVRTLTGVQDARLDDNFFELGGDSASAVVLVFGMKKLGWTDAGVRDVLRAENLRVLADRLRERSV